MKKTADFHVDVLLNSAAGEEFEIKVQGSPSSLVFKTGVQSWDKVDAGLISLPAGISAIQLIKKKGVAKTSVKSIELIENSKRTAYLERVKQFKANTGWFSKAGYDLMFQYGPWTYPETGETQKTAEELAVSFDIPSFVNMVKSTGASYVIWSLTWWEYKMPMPVKAVDDIVGHKGLTTSYDFIGKLAEELQKNNIRFMLYYHVGHGSRSNQPTEWWLAQKWPAEYSLTGQGDRTVFFENWIKVISEIGSRLGNKLDGWWFDDGLVYYPAPFEKLGEAARTGNRNRLVAYNPWVCVRYTEFQDTFFGEGSHCEVVKGSAPSGGDGIFTSGPQKGLLQHSMFTMENDWGIHSPDQKVVTTVNKDNLMNWVKSVIQRNVPLSINLIMWEGGKVSDTSLNLLKALNGEIRK